MHIGAFVVFYLNRERFKLNPCCAKPDLSFFENTVDSDQLASSSDQDLHCFTTLTQTTFFQLNCIDIREGCRT